MAEPEVPTPSAPATDGAADAAIPIGPRASGRRSRLYDVVIFLAIVALAFALRLVYVLQQRSSPLFEHPVMDELYHDQWAQAIAAGETFMEGPYFRAPLYPFFLAAVYRIFGHDYLAPRIVQGVLGSLSCGLVFVIGRSLFGRAVGAVAGFVAASYWMLIYFDGELLITSLVVFLDLVPVWLLVRGMRRPGWLAYGLAGLALGVSAIARPNILLFAPAVVVWLIVSYRGRWSRVLAYVLSFGVGCIVPIVPVSVRNYVVGKDFVLISSQAGVNFYIGNNPQSDGMTAIVPGTPGDWWGGYHAAVQRAEDACGRELRASEVSRYYFGEAWKFIRGRPTQFLKLTAYKLWLFWGDWEIGNNKSIYFWTEHFTPLVRFLPLGFAVVGPLGILGVALCWRRRAECFPLWGFVLVYMASVVTFFCNSRYRTPVLGPLIILAVSSAFWCVSAARQRRWRHLAGALAVLVPAAIVVNAGPRQDRSKTDPMSYQRLATAYRQQGSAELAIENYRKALDMYPGYLMARFYLGAVLLQSGRLAEAIEELRLAVASPARAELGETPAMVAAAHYALGTALLRSGKPAEAVDHLRVATRLDPRDAARNAWLPLGAALKDLGRKDEAIDAYRRGLEITPDRPKAQFGLATLLAETGELEEAVNRYRSALSAMPRHAEALHGLGVALLKLGRAVEAVEPLRHCVELRPRNVAAWDALSQALIESAQYREAVETLRRSLSLGDAALINKLAWLLATCPEDGVRDGESAVRYMERVCADVERCPPAYLDTLAAALAEAGRFNEAVDVARRALDLARTADSALAERIKSRLALYEARRPYRERRAAREALSDG